MCVGVDACVHVYACVWVGRRSSCGSGGGGCLSQCFSFFMHTHVYAHVHLPHSSSICSFLYVSLACKALSIVCLRENIVFFLSLLQSSPLSVSAYLIHSAPLITLFFTSLNHSSTTSSSVCLFHLLSHPASHFYLHLHQRCPCVVYLIREVGLFFLLPWKHQSKSPICSETQDSNTPKV